MIKIIHHVTTLTHMLTYYIKRFSFASREDVVFKLQKEYHIFSNKKYFIIYFSRPNKPVSYCYDNVALLLPVLIPNPLFTPTTMAGSPCRLLCCTDVLAWSHSAVNSSIIYHVFTVIPLFFL